MPTKPVIYCSCTHVAAYITCFNYKRFACIQCVHNIDKEDIELIPSVTQDKIVGCDLCGEKGAGVILNSFCTICKLIICKSCSIARDGVHCADGKIKIVHDTCSKMGCTNIAKMIIYDDSINHNGVCYEHNIINKYYSRIDLDISKLISEYLPKLYIPHFYNYILTNRDKYRNILEIEEEFAKWVEISKRYIQIILKLYNMLNDTTGVFSEVFYVTYFNYRYNELNAEAIKFWENTKYLCAFPGWCCGACHTCLESVYDSDIYNARYIVASYNVIKLIEKYDIYHLDIIDLKPIKLREYLCVDAITHKCDCQLVDRMSPQKDDDISMQILIIVALYKNGMNLDHIRIKRTKLAKKLGHWARNKTNTEIARDPRFNLTIFCQCIWDKRN